MPAHSQARPRTPRPLDAAKLEELALAYVARFATSKAKLAAYLTRKVRERGWEGPENLEIEALVERFAHKDYVNDSLYARMKTEGLLRRGYGLRRIQKDLQVCGIEENLSKELRPSARAERQAALVYARRRRLGLYCRGEVDRSLYEKQLAAMLRAGHGMEMARFLLNCTSVDEAEAWIFEAEHD